MDFESILKNIGSFGRYQKLLLCILGYALIAYTMQLYVQVFSAGKSDHWCASWGNEDCPDTGIDCSGLKKDLSVPKVYNDDGTVEYKQCFKYNVSGMDMETAIGLGKNMTTRLGEIPCDEGWEHDRSVFSDTMIMDFELVCGRSALPNIAQSTYFGGFMAGSALGGLTSDLIGRRLTILIFTSLMCIFALATAVTPVMSLFIGLRFFVGFFSRTASLSQFVLLMEVVHPRRRVLVTNLYFLGFALAYIVLTGLAKLIYRWRILQVVITLFLVSGLPLQYFFVLESPRWLLIKGKTEKALKTINKIAAINKKQDVVMREEDLKNAQMESEPESSDMIDILKQLIRSPVMVMMTANMAFNWCVQSFVFYGLSLSTSSLGIDPYLSFIISGGIEIPAYIACMFVPEWLGRRLSMTIIMVLGGICCCCSTIFPMGLNRALVAFGGKFCISMTFNLVYTWSAELIPTSSRSTGMGMFSMFSRVGSMLAPFMLLFEDVWINLPYMIFGVAAIAAGLLALFIPETKGKPLPTMLEETSALYRKNPMKNETEISGENNKVFTTGEDSGDL